MSRAAGRYAKAIFEMALDKSVLDSVNIDMISIAETVRSNQELADFLSNPVVKNEIKLAAVNQVFAGVQSLTKDAFTLLNVNGRFEILAQVAEIFQALSDEHKGIITAKVTTAVPMDAALESQVIKKIQSLAVGKTVRIENTIDPTLIGGFVIRIGDMQYNASLASKLQQLKQEFSN